MAERRPARNLELKVRCDATALELVRERLAAEGVGQPERIAQVDTYFRVAQGRLKLRRITKDAGAPAAELIAYVRPDEARARWSAYHRVPIPAAEAPGLLAALAGTVGVLVEVVKTREVAVRGRTRVHLDAVERLGTFVELETVLDGQSEAGAAAELAATAQFLGLDRREPVAGSYSDLVLAMEDDMRKRTEDR